MSVATTVRVRLSHVVSSVASLSIEDDPSASFGYSYLTGSVAAHSENKNNELDPLPEWFLERKVYPGDDIAPNRRSKPSVPENGSAWALDP
eukprot:CAMPEP_0194407648 /NCGR_PEP_ID=MMETSP0176-20130528/5645_1 /TAXON_ID=216777 /ORGANISM="Proboscia alata, Strain PI-D3" /LENGTH=90 /DNA_ID=CAMNT_0039207373 /DNA_START=48 /DNA_END=316 /DNA_ORIENTATION=+